MKYRPFLDTDIIAVDYETTGLPYIGKVCIFSVVFTWCNDPDGYTEVHYGIGNFEKRLKEFWFSRCQAVAHNLAFELWFTIEEGYIIAKDKPLHDTMIQFKYLNNLANRMSLDYCYEFFAGFSPECATIDKQVTKAFKIYGSFDKIPKKLMEEYQTNDGQRIALLFLTMFKCIQDSPAYEEYLNEIELIKMTVAMYRRGITVDKVEASKQISFMKKEIEQNTIRTESLVGHPINLNSPKQLIHLLYTELHMPLTGKKSLTGNEALDLLPSNPIIDCIKKERAYTKGTAMIESYLELSVNNILHPSIITNRAKTGRESSEHPNMQNISKEVKAGQQYTVPARKCFIPRKGYYFIGIDYSGIEMRLGVQGTNSERLYELCDNDFDFHNAFAEVMYGELYTNPIQAITFALLTNKSTILEWKKSCLKIGKVASIELWYPKAKKAMRNKAKNARFAMFYGAGLETTSRTLGLTMENTKIGYLRDKELYPELYAFMKDCTTQAEKEGGIYTYFGRFLRVPREALYSATDFKIQGSAAALFKHAQVDVHKWLIKERLDIYPILPVHDEIIFEVNLKYKEEILKEILENIKRIMCQYKEIKVKLNVEVSIMSNNLNDKVGME